MSAFLQLLIGLSPGLVLFLLLSVFAKRARARNIVLTVLFAAAMVACVVFSFVYAEESTVPEGSLQSQMPADDALELVFALAEQGDCEAAMDLFRSLCGEYDYTEEFTRCLARLYTLNADVNAADVLYGKSGGTKDETSLVAQARASGDRDVLAQAQQAVMQTLSDCVDAEQSQELAALMCETAKLYEIQRKGVAIDPAAAKLLVSQFEELSEDEPGYFRLSAVQISRAQALILAQDYAAVAGMLDTHSSHETVMIASELYIYDVITERSFRKSVVGDVLKRHGEVLDQLEDIFADVYDEEKEPEAYAKAEKFLTELRGRLDMPGYAFLKSRLSDYAMAEGSLDASKAYIQLSKLENHMGNEKQSANYLDRALLSVGACADDNFTVPMYELISVVSTERDDTEKLKNIPENVDTVLDHTLPFNMEAKTYKPDDEAAASGTPDDAHEPEDEEQAFDSFMSDQISQKRAQINILSVNTSEFATVKAYITVDTSVAYTDAELRELLRVSDCGVDISEFTVKKTELNTANILLCCDVSGSMSEEINDLREAVREFVNTSGEVESVALVCFDSNIVTSLDFYSTDEQLLEAAQNMDDGGGTNIYGTVLKCIDMFPNTVNSANCVILMSDGADGSEHSDAAIAENITGVCAARGIEIYSVGLGDGVDSEYLNEFTIGTGGYYVYAESSATLSEFFSNLRAQFYNRYELTFTAEDTLTNSRELKVSLTGGDFITSDTCRYTLDGSPADAQDGNAVALQNGVCVTGVDKRLLYRGQAQTVRLFGTGFSEDLKISLELRGDLSYDQLKLTYVDKNTYSFQVPASMACGQYDVRVTVDGKTAILSDEITVVSQGSEKQVRFGPYSFTAYTVAREENTTTLSGFVTMNGWLHFAQDVTLLGDLDSGSITMRTDGEAFTIYEQSTAEGIAKWMAGLGIGVNMDLSGDIRLYNDDSVSPTSMEYPTEAVAIPALYVTNFLELATPGVRLHPHTVRISATEFTTKLPMQDKLVAAVYKNPFTFEQDIAFFISGTAVDADIELEVKETADEDNGLSPVPITAFNMKSTIELDEFKLDLNTMENKYAIDFEIGLNFITTVEDAAIGLHMAWDDVELCPSQFVMMFNYPVEGNISGVPVTYERFKLGLENIDPDKDVWDWTLVGGMDISAAKIRDVISGVEKFTGNFSVAALEDAKLSICFGEPYVKAEGKATLCTVELGSFEIEFGKLSYTNLLLDMDSVNASGLRAASSIGMKWDSNNCDIDITGTGELDMHTRFLGVKVSGDFDVEVKWWVFRKSWDKHGEINLGVWRDNDGLVNFGVVSSCTTRTKGTTKFYAIYNARTGSDCGKQKL